MAGKNNFDNISDNSFKNSLANTLKNLPGEPGVYRFYSLADELLYIGKAKNLKNRVTTYFQKNRQKENPRLSLMVSQINRIDYTVVGTENESLILEANLINSLQPKYNIQLKDDRSYLYVRITNSQIPFITFTRQKYDKKSTYYGPYTKKFDIISVLRLLRLIFPYCEKKSFTELGDYSKPCQYVQLRQCDGICCGRESVESYNAKISQIKLILSGKTKSVKTWLNNKIKEYIEIENYEMASLWRDRIATLDRVIGDQKIILPQPIDLDIVTLIHEQKSGISPIASVFVQSIREGKMINVNNFLLTGGLEDMADFGNEVERDESSILAVDKEKSDLSYNFLRTFLQSYYSRQDFALPGTSESSELSVLVQCYENVVEV
jgi:excinuclease ABC subunit C